MVERLQQVGLCIFGVLVTIICATALVFLFTGRELTNELMFACLAGLIVLYGFNKRK